MDRGKSQETVFEWDQKRAKRLIAVLDADENLSSMAHRTLTATHVLGSEVITIL